MSHSWAVSAFSVIFGLLLVAPTFRIQYMLLFVPSTMQVHYHVFPEFPQLHELGKNGIFRKAGHDYRKKESLLSN